MFPRNDTPRSNSRALRTLAFRALDTVRAFALLEDAGPGAAPEPHTVLSDAAHPHRQALRSRMVRRTGAVVPREQPCLAPVRREPARRGPSERAADVQRTAR